jgi:hypothetical protein
VFEHRTQGLLPRRAFAGRLARHALAAGALVGASLAVGVVGYHALAGHSWVDAFLNASMILSGMGPVSPLPNDAAKIFAALYALYSGLVLIATGALLLAPIVHRMLHRLHLEPRGRDRDDG